MPVPEGRILVGRQRELEALRYALDSARTGAGGSGTLLRGDAGIGKTALLEWAEEQARADGFTVLRAVGAEAEAELAFGALHQILWPLLEHSDALHPRQRNALECVLGLREGLPPGGFLVGASALALLADEARRNPLLIVVDDLHWVDSSSAGVLAFLHRRITDLDVVILSASRPDGTTVEGWPAKPVHVGALRPAEAGELLRLWHPALAAGAADGVLADAGGNPLALMELPRQLHPDELKGIVPLPERLPLGQRLERLFADRIGSLSAEAAQVLLLTALSGGPAAWQAGSRLRTLAGDRAEEVLDRIEASGLAQLDSSGRVVFRHPLVRSAVVATASGRERRAAHRALAAELAADDPRRLTHEASATLLPDEELAARLQEAGVRIARRGGDAEGALLLDRAAALSADPDARARRLTWAAVAAARGGRLRYTARLVEQLKRGPVPRDIAPLFAYAVVYVDQSHRVDFESSFTLLPHALDALAEPGAESFGGLAEQVFFKLLLAATYTDDPRGWTALASHLDQVSPLARLCHRAWSDPARTAHGASAELLDMADTLSAEQEAGGAWLLLWTASAVDLGDGELWRRFHGQHAYATQGPIAKARAYQNYLHGRWDSAESCLREAEAAEELGYHCNALIFRLSYAHFLAGRGDEDGLRETARLIGGPAVAARMRFVTDHLAHLHGLAALARGRYDEAYESFAALTPPGGLPRGVPWFHLPFYDLVDAAVHTGRLAEARAHVAAGEAARMAEISGHHAFLHAAASALLASAPSRSDVAGAPVPGSPATEGAEISSQAMDVDACFRAAYDVPGAEQWAFDLARLRLAHGTWLRRHHRRESREVLAAAHRTFRSLRALPWVERCERELRAAGHQVPAPTGGTALLTPQELRIARLAANGMTNKAIGAQLRLSPRTVSAHLYKIFPKLGITSRAALARMLQED